MNNVIRTTVVLIFMVVIFPVSGLTFTGKEYTRVCQELKTDINSESRSSEICASYTLGVLNTRQEVVSMMYEVAKNLVPALEKEENNLKKEFIKGQLEGFAGVMRLYCINDKTFTIPQAVLVALKYLQENPAELPYSATGSILTSLGIKFPCSNVKE